MRVVSKASMLVNSFVMINEFMNTNWSDVSKHPELQWKLMCLAGCGKIQSSL